MTLSLVALLLIGALVTLLLIALTPRGEHPVVAASTSPSPPPMSTYVNPAPATTATVTVPPITMSTTTTTHRTTTHRTTHHKPTPHTATPADTGSSAKKAAAVMDGYLAAVAKGNLAKAKKFGCDYMDSATDDIRFKLKARRSGAPKVKGPDIFEANVVGTRKGKPIHSPATIVVHPDLNDGPLCVSMVAAIGY